MEAIMADSLQTNPEYDTYQQEIESLIRELSVVKSEIVSNTCVLHDDVIHANYKESAKNLIHYLALRCQDRRPLQMRLASMGLSSLGRLESHVLTTIDAVLRILQQLQQNPHPLVNNAEKVDFIKGQKLLDEHTEAVLGKCPDGRTVRIMVTMPTEAAHDYALVRDLVSAGMDCMRINCAHDDVLHWENMVKHLRLAEKETGRSCRVVMDVAGPKLRTGPVEPGPKVMKIRPVRDAFGRVVMPARVFLTGENEPDSPSFHFDYRLPVSRRWLSKLNLNNSRGQ
jgi:pyruvate kinase